METLQKALSYFPQGLESVSVYDLILLHFEFCQISFIAIPCLLKGSLWGGQKRKSQLIQGLLTHTHLCVYRSFFKINENKWHLIHFICP